MQQGQRVLFYLFRWSESQKENKKKRIMKLSPPGKPGFKCLIDWYRSDEKDWISAEVDTFLLSTSFFRFMNCSSESEAMWALEPNLMMINWSLCHLPSFLVASFYALFQAEQKEGRKQEGNRDEMDNINKRNSLRMMLMAMTSGSRDWWT